jgi:hypothetical protein
MARHYQPQSILTLSLVNFWDAYQVSWDCENLLKGWDIPCMTPHVAGTTLSAQTRYAAGVREILECWFENRPIRDEYLIVDKGKLAGTGAHSYSAGDATGGSEEASQFAVQK